MLPDFHIYLSFLLFLLIQEKKKKTQLFFFFPLSGSPPRLLAWWTCGGTPWTSRTARWKLRAVRIPCVCPPPPASTTCPSHSFPPMACLPGLLWATPHGGCLLGKDQAPSSKLHPEGTLWVKCLGKWSSSSGLGIKITLTLRGSLPWSRESPGNLLTGLGLYRRWDPSPLHSPSPPVENLSWPCQWRESGCPSSKCTAVSPQELSRAADLTVMMMQLQWWLSENCFFHKRGPTASIVRRHRAALAALPAPGTPLPVRCSGCLGCAATAALGVASNGM